MGMDESLRADLVALSRAIHDEPEPQRSRQAQCKAVVEGSDQDGWAVFQIIQLRGALKPNVVGLPVNDQ